MFAGFQQWKFCSRYEKILRAYDDILEKCSILEKINLQKCYL